MAFLEIPYLPEGPMPLLPGNGGVLNLGFWFGLFLAVLFMVSSIAIAKEPVVTSENELKTAFVYQFSKYVSWPKSAKNRKKIVLGVAADDDMLEAISRLDGRLSHGMTIVVVPVDGSSDLKNVDMLYLGKRHKADKDIIDHAIKYHILTISDEDDAIQRGIIIGLYKADSRLRFKINLKVATKSNLKLSSRLLKLAVDLIK